MPLTTPCTNRLKLHVEGLLPLGPRDAMVPLGRLQCVTQPAPAAGSFLQRPPFPGRAPLAATATGPPVVQYPACNEGEDSNMASAIYASLSAFLVVWLSLNVIKARRTKQVSVADGGDDELKTAMAAQSNALDYLPIALLLLFTLEYNRALLVLVHTLGIVLLVGRVIHAKAMLTNNLQRRVLGMQITIWVIIGLAIANLFFIPYVIPHDTGASFGNAPP